MLRVLLTMLVAMAVGVATAEAKPKGAPKGPKAPAHGAQKPKVTPEERFKQLDKNADGFLTVEELVGRGGKKGPSPEATEKAKALLKAKDKDNDGKLSLAEFTAKPGKGPGGGKKGGKAK
jgi:hypothetical protein